MSFGAGGCQSDVVVSVGCRWAGIYQSEVVGCQTGCGYTWVLLVGHRLVSLDVTGCHCKSLHVAGHRHTMLDVAFDSFGWMLGWMSLDIIGCQLDIIGCQFGIIGC